MSPKRFLRRSWYADHAALLAIILGVAIVLGGTISNALDIRGTSSDLKRSICALRHERQQSVANAVQFLKENPNGIPGVSRADILRSIKLQQQTVRAFRFAGCSPFHDEDGGP